MAFVSPFDPMNNALDALALAVHCSELDTRMLSVPVGVRLAAPGLPPNLVQSLRATATLLLAECPELRL